MVLELSTDVVQASDRWLGTLLGKLGRTAALLGLSRRWDRSDRYDWCLEPTMLEAVLNPDSSLSLHLLLPWRPQ